MSHCSWFSEGQTPTLFSYWPACSNWPDFQNVWLWLTCCLALIKPQSPRISVPARINSIIWMFTVFQSLQDWFGVFDRTVLSLSALLGPRARRSTTLSCQPPSGQCWPLREWREVMGMGMFVHSQESRDVNKARFFVIFVDQLSSLDTPICPDGLCSKCL